MFRTASGGWTLHQLRHSRPTHLAQAGVPGPLVMAKSHHGSVKTRSSVLEPVSAHQLGAKDQVDAETRPTSNGTAVGR